MKQKSLEYCSPYQWHNSSVQSTIITANKLSRVRSCMVKYRHDFMDADLHKKYRIINLACI